MNRGRSQEDTWMITAALFTREVSRYHEEETLGQHLRISVYGERQKYSWNPMVVNTERKRENWQKPSSIHATVARPLTEGIQNHSSFRQPPKSTSRPSQQVKQFSHWSPLKMSLPEKVRLKSFLPSPFSPGVPLHAGTERKKLRGNSLETPNVWGLSSFHPNVSKQPPPPQCLGFCLLFTPRLLSRRAGSDVDATAAAHRTRKPRQHRESRRLHQFPALPGQPLPLPTDPTGLNPPRWSLPVPILPFPPLPPVPPLPPIMGWMISSPICGCNRRIASAQSSSHSLPRRHSSNWIHRTPKWMAVTIIVHEQNNDMFSPYNSSNKNRLSSRLTGVMVSSDGRW